MTSQTSAPVLGELDVRIVEQGDAVDALLCSTDNGCTTNPSNGC